MCGIGRGGFYMMADMMAETIAKILGAVLLVFGTTAFGVYKGCLYNSRLLNLYEIKKAFLYVQGEIRYMNTPMAETLEGAAHQIRGNSRRFFSRVSKELQAGSQKELKQVWEDAVSKEMGGECLEREAVEVLREMGGQLGCLDRQAQGQAIDYFLSKWEFLIEKRRREKNEKLKLYYVCGIMCGLLMVILIV